MSAESGMRNDGAESVADPIDYQLSTISYQLIALDLDGTVMGHDLVIPPAVHEAIGAAQASAIALLLKFLLTWGLAQWARPLPWGWASLHRGRSGHTAGDRASS